jgi:hypothetical protein
LQRLERSMRAQLLYDKRIYPPVDDIHNVIGLLAQPMKRFVASKRKILSTKVW